MTSLVENLKPVEDFPSDRVYYVSERRKRVRSAILVAVSECGGFVKIYKLSHRHWIAVADVKEIRKGKLRLTPQIK